MAKFSGTSYLNMDQPLTVALPFSVMGWYRSNTTIGTVFSLGAAGTTNAIRIRAASSTLQLEYVSGGTASGAASTSVITNVWIFFVARNIALANRRISAIRMDGGSTTNGSSAVSVTTAALDQVRIGALVNATEPFSGDIAEFCYLDADVQDDNGVLSVHLLRQLAFRGPWSCPWLHDSIVEYRSLRQTFGSETEMANGEVYQRGDRRSWLTTGGVSVGEGPPIYSDYVRPGQSRRMGMV